MHKDVDRVSPQVKSALGSVCLQHGYHCSCFGEGGEVLLEEFEYAIQRTHLFAVGPDRPHHHTNI